MQIRRLTESVAVAGQIRPEDVPAIAAAGYRSLICNRPDGEEPGQPTFSAIAAAAEAAGLEVRNVPVRSGAVTLDQVESFRRELDELPGPVLAYCRSGTRSCTLWALAEAGTRPAEEIVALAKSAGYDMSALFARR